MGKTNRPASPPASDATNAPAQDRYIVPGLVRGLKALTAFTPERRRLSLGEIATHLGTTRSAAFRTVYTLTELGYLLADPSQRAYELGPAVLRLGYGVHASRALVEIALPELERLRDEIDWSTHLGVRDGRSVLYLIRAPSRMGLGSIVHVGSRLPASGTSMGRVLLADLDEAALIQLYRDESFARFPVTTPRTLSGLLAQWRGDRAAETVAQYGRFETGVVAIAAAVRDLSGRTIAAVNATRPTETGAVDEDDAEAARRLLAAARRIARQLGVEPDAPQPGDGA